MSYPPFDDNFDPNMITVNDKNYFTMKWTQNINGTETPIDSIYCVDLVSNYWKDVNDAEKSQTYGELDSAFQLCPNITEFKTSGGFFGNTNLKLTIDMTVVGSKFNGNHYVVASDLTRFFNADDFNEN